MIDPHLLVSAAGPLIRAIPLFRLKADSRFTIADYIEKQVSRNRNQNFILFEERLITYSQFNSLANQFAHWALGVGLKSGDTLGLLMGNCPEYVAIWAGLSKVGVKAALINSNLKGQSIRHALDVANASHLLLGSRFVDNLGDTNEVVDLSRKVYAYRDDGQASTALAKVTEITEEVAEQPTSNPDPGFRRHVRSGDPAFYIYTSGTTGFPKAVKFNHQRLALIGLFGPLMGLGKRRVVYCPLPLYHGAGGVGAVMMAMGSGGAVAIARKFSASRFWDDIRHYKASGTVYIGELCRFLLAQPPNENDGEHNLKFMFGLGLRPDIWERFQQRFDVPRIVECYGATESNLGSINFFGRVGSVGKIRGGFLLRYDLERDELVTDANGRYVVCDTDEVGELVGKIPRDPKALFGQAQSYTDNDEMKKKILRSVKYPGDAYFRSGDLLRRDAEGYYYFVDRIGDTFRWKGENVSTDEVSQALSVYPGLETVNAYGVEIDGHEGRAGMVALTFRDGQFDHFDGASFYELAYSSLPNYAIPVFVRLQTESDVTSTFKLRKVALRNQGFDPKEISDPIYVRDDESKAYVRLTDISEIRVC